MHKISITSLLRMKIKRVDDLLVVAWMFTLGNLFIGIFMSESKIDHSARVVGSIQSSTYNNVLVMDLTAIVVMSIVLIIEYISCTKITMFTNKDFILTIRLLGVLIISSTIIYFYAVPKDKYFIILCCYVTRILWIGCGSLWYAADYGKEVWTAVWIYLLVAIGLVSFQLTLLFSMYPSLRSLGAVVDALNATGTFVYLVLLILWYRHLWRKRKCGAKIPTEEWNCTVYTSLCFITILMSFLCTAIAEKPYLIEEFSVSSLVSTDFSYLVFVVCSFLVSRNLGNQIKFA